MLQAEIKLEGLERTIEEIVTSITAPLVEEIRELRMQVKEIKHKEYYSKADLTKMFKVSKKTIDDWIREGRFPKADMKIGENSPRWSKTLIEEFEKEKRKRRDKSSNGF